jgi:glucose-1-phosphate thymidylyltransferase
VIRGDSMTRLVGLIPAAGRGSRLTLLPSSKELFPLGLQEIVVNGAPITTPKATSQYLLESMARAGVRRFFFILGEGKSPIMDYYGNGHRFGVEIAYLYQEELWGMPFALDLARPWLDHATVLFGMPDTICAPADAFVQLLERQHATGADLSLGLFRTDQPQRFGMVALDEADHVVGCVDKPTQTSLEYLWGIACWRPRFTAFMGKILGRHRYDGQEVVLGDIFQQAVEAKLTVQGVRFDEGSYMDIGTPESLVAAMKYFACCMTDE